MAQPYCETCESSECLYIYTLGQSDTAYFICQTCLSDIKNIKYIIHNEGSIYKISADPEKINSSL